MSEGEIRTEQECVRRTGRRCISPTLIRSFVFGASFSVAMAQVLDRPGTPPRPEQRAIQLNVTRPERMEVVRPEERATGAEGKSEVKASPARAEEHSGVAARSSAERIQCFLVLASNSEKLKAPEPELARIGRKIEKVFGYHQIEVVGSDKAVQDGYEHWLVPSQDFWMSVRSRRESEGMYLLDLNIFHGRRRIIETEAKLSTDSPLLIRGPMCSRGQLVIALQIGP